MGAWIVGVLFVFAGAMHFVKPAPYLAMMPGWLPAHVLLVQLSGVAEMAGGAGLCWRRTRRAAAWGLIALLVAVFPANLQVALHGWPGMDVARWVLWARLPLQPVIGWIVWRVGVK